MICLVCVINRSYVYLYIKNLVFKRKVEIINLKHFMFTKSVLHSIVFQVLKYTIQYLNYLKQKKNILRELTNQDFDEFIPIPRAPKHRKGTKIKVGWQIFLFMLTFSILLNTLNSAEIKLLTV